MAQQYIKSVPGLIVTKPQASSLPTPALATDGESIASWSAPGTQFTPTALVTITANGTCSLTGATLYGYEPTKAQWFALGTLNGGASIALTSTVGYAQTFSMPAVFTALAVGATVSANNVGYDFMPVETYNV